MKALIIGGAGMVGRKLAERLASDGRLGGRELTDLHLADAVEPRPLEGPSGDAKLSTADLTEPGAAERLIADRPDVVFHLAAIVSGEAERDFAKGYAVNLDGTRALLDAIHDATDAAPDYRPRVVFTSSIAVFGRPFPPVIPDDFNLTPLTSYGAQKAMGELLLADHTRRGHMDGITIRLPTICVRPGKPNAAASSFFSGILREPINGEEAVLPVPEDVRHWFASPRSAVGYLTHAATLPMEEVGPHASLDMPGLSATVGEQIEALGRVVGEDAVKLIRRERDPVVESIVAGWPEAFEARRARALGFTAETSMDEIVRVYLEDEMGR